MNKKDAIEKACYAIIDHDGLTNLSDKEVSQLEQVLIDAHVSAQCIELILLWGRFSSAPIIIDHYDIDALERYVFLHCAMHAKSTNNIYF